MYIPLLTRTARRFRKGKRQDARASLAMFLGPLELRVLECLWRQPGGTSVRGLLKDFPGTAYTTLMTTLDRLFRKGLLDRTRQERAFLYVPVFTLETLEQHLAASAIARLLGSVSTRGAARPILSSFVETVGRRDAVLLDELEALIREERRKAGEPDRGGSKR